METKLASRTDLETLQNLNRDYINSVQRSDVPRFDEILAEDFLCSNPDGSLIDRAAFLKQTALPVKISNLQTSEVKIRIMGDVRHHSRPDDLHGSRRPRRIGSLHGRVGPPTRPMARRLGPRDSLLIGWHPRCIVLERAPEETESNLKGDAR